jgi:hypothetical protein
LFIVFSHALLVVVVGGGGGGGGGGANGSVDSLDHGESGQLVRVASQIACTGTTIHTTSMERLIGQ